VTRGAWRLRELVGRPTQPAELLMQPAVHLAHACARRGGAAHAPALRHATRTHAAGTSARNTSGAKLTSPAGRGAITAAKCCRLLRSICTSAIAEEQIPRNPCAIPGAGEESRPERPVATVPHVLALAEAAGARWRARVWLVALSRCASASLPRRSARTSTPTTRP